MNCEQTLELLTDLHEGAASPDQQAAAGEHLSHCDRCRSESRRIADLASRLVASGAAWRSAPVRIGEPMPVVRSRRPVLSPRVLARAAAAIAIVCGTAAVMLWTPRSSANSAMAAMLHRLERSGAVRYTASVPGQGEVTFLAQGTAKARMQWPDGRTLVMNTEKGEASILLPDKHVVRQARPDEFPFDPYRLLESLAYEPLLAELAVEEVNGVPARVVRLLAPRQLGLTGPGGRTPELTVWLSLEDQLPLKIELPMEGPDGGAMTLHSFEFDVPVDDSTFDTSPPGYTPGPPSLDPPSVRVAVTTTLRNISMACMIYAQEHEQRWPESLKDLADRYLPPGGLDNPRGSESGAGFAYRPPTPQATSDATASVIVYETFASWPGEAAVVYVDGHVQMISDQARFRSLTGEK